MGTAAVPNSQPAPTQPRHSLPAVQQPGECGRPQRGLTRGYRGGGGLRRKTAVSRAAPLPRAAADGGQRLSVADLIADFESRGPGEMLTKFPGRSPGPSERPCQADCGDHRLIPGCRRQCWARRLRWQLQSCLVVLGSYADPLLSRVALPAPAALAVFTYARRFWTLTASLPGAWLIYGGVLGYKRAVQQMMVCRYAVPM